MNESEPRIRFIGADEMKHTAEMVGRAFLDEPLFVYGYPDEGERVRVLPIIMSSIFQHGLLFGTVLGIGEPITAAAIVYRASEPIFSEEKTALSEGDLREQLGQGNWERYERMLTPWIAVDEMVHEQSPYPYWYLDLLAVDPLCQGRGLGSRLLNHLHELADADGLPTVLLTFRARTVPLYERNGYEIVCAGTEADSGLRFWGMKRPPCLED